MEMISIRARKEVVLCAKCKQCNEFLYLSDFSYGEKLVLINSGTGYAFINFFKDEEFDEYEKIVSEILQSHKIELSKSIFAQAINQTFGITCDNIQGHSIDLTAKDKKCCSCESTDFEFNLVEPEQLIEIDLPLITHENWKVMKREEKVQLAEKELKSKKII